MRTILWLLLLLTLPKILEAQNSSTTTTKKMTMIFKEYSEGDFPHLIFLDIKSKKEYDFRHINENNLGNCKLLQDDKNSTFGYKANPKYINKKFYIVTQRKTVLDNDEEGNVIKIKDWVIISIKAL